MHSREVFQGSCGSTGLTSGSIIWLSLEPCPKELPLACGVSRVNSDPWLVQGLLLSSCTNPASELLMSRYFKCRLWLDFSLYHFTICLTLRNFQYLYQSLAKLPWTSVQAKFGYRDMSFSVMVFGLSFAAHCYTKQNDKFLKGKIILLHVWFSNHMSNKQTW